MSLAERGDSEPVLLRLAVADLLAWSDAMDTQLRLRLAAYREGWAAAELAHADDYERGFADGCMAVKRAHADAVRLVRDDAARWPVRGEQRTRATFGRPHPADYKGGTR